MVREIFVVVAVEHCRYKLASNCVSCWWEYRSCSTIIIIAILRLRQFHSATERFLLVAIATTRRIFKFN